MTFRLHFFQNVNTVSGRVKSCAPTKVTNKIETDVAPCNVHKRLRLLNPKHII